MTIKVNFSSTNALYERPEILQHPQIPAPIAGINPRTVLGTAWWDKTRREAYQRNNYHCMACAGSPDDDPYYSRLEAHECYDIDWRKATATYTETVALCWRCHNFIHAGRLRALADAGKITLAALHNTLTYGMSVLEKADLHPFWRTYVIARTILLGEMEAMTIKKARMIGIIDPYSVITPPASYWRVVIQGQKYRRASDGSIEKA